MRKFLKASLAKFRFSLIVAAIWCLSDQLVECQSSSFDVTYQYFACKNLKMIKTRDALGQYYYPDPSVPNNSLNESFFISQGLNTMNMNQAMNLFKKIYNESDLKFCTGSFCDCVNLRFVDNYALIFRNNTIFQQSQPIITSFVSKNQGNLFSFQSRLKYMFSAGPSLPTLAQFSVNYDYTALRISFYNNTFSCFKEPDYMTSYSCQWSAMSDNGQVLETPSNSVWEQQMTCRLLSVAKCTPEHQRYYALTIWVNYFPQLNWPAGSNMTAYFDKMIASAFSMVTKPKLNLQQVYLSIYGHMIESNSFDKGQKYYKDDRAPKKSFSCLDSNDLVIQCQINVLSNQNSYFSSINVTFYFPKMQAKQYNFRSFTTSDIKNGTLIKDNKGKTLLQIFQFRPGMFELFDFNSDSQLKISPQSVYLITTKNLLKAPNSAGVLVNGIK